MDFPYFFPTPYVTGHNWQVVQDSVSTSTEAGAQIVFPVSSNCSDPAEYLKCWPHYLPQELTVVFTLAVYGPPSTDAGIALMIQLSVAFYFFFGFDYVKMDILTLFY